MDPGKLWLGDGQVDAEYCLEDGDVAEEGGEEELSRGTEEDEDYFCNLRGELLGASLHLLAEGWLLLIRMARDEAGGRARRRRSGGRGRLLLELDVLGGLSVEAGPSHGGRQLW